MSYQLMSLSTGVVASAMVETIHLPEMVETILT
jgi:hypothetical protein